jgi:hypothetical protein
VAANEALAREVNEAIERGQWPGEQEMRTAFRCECARADCNRLVEVTPADYEQVRAHSRRFIVFPGHERPDVETVVLATPDYVVVDKRDEAGAVAAETDPRD